MRATKAASVEQYQIAGRYERLREKLSEDTYAAHRQKPLAYWAMPTDRRLPLVFLGRTLESLLESPFSELISTPGIGKKKIVSFLKLLSRAIDTPVEELRPDEFSLVATADLVDSFPSDETDDGFDPDRITEITWAKWRATVTQHGLDRETLGHLAENLKDLTRSSWRAPLQQYTRFSLAEIRTMRTHGEKRVRGVLEVFYHLNRLLESVKTAPHLIVRLHPKRIETVEQWVERTLQAERLPDDTEIFDGFTYPLLEQLRVDATAQLENLAKQRLGLGGPIVPVRQIAKQSGLTRARVYQLLNEISEIMAIRWPSGPFLIDQWCVQFQQAAVSETVPFDMARFRAAVDLFFPGRRTELDDPILMEENGEAQAD